MRGGAFALLIGALFIIIILLVLLLLTQLNSAPSRNAGASKDQTKQEAPQEQPKQETPQNQQRKQEESTTG